MDGYCEKAGFAATARFCFTRTEGDSQATACDYLAVGRSTNDGRWGPTWSYNDKPCTAGAGENGCTNHPDNQFLVNIRGDGKFEACAAADIPLSQDPDPARVALRLVHDRERRGLSVARARGLGRSPEPRPFLSDGIATQPVTRIILFY